MANHVFRRIFNGSFENYTPFSRQPELLGRAFKDVA